MHRAQRVQLAPLRRQRVSHLAQEPTRAALAGKQSQAHHQLPMAVKIAAQERISLLLVTHLQRVLTALQERTAQ